LRYEFDQGVIEYVEPTIVDYLEMLGACGYNSQDMSNPEQLNDLVLTARLIKSAKTVVKKVDVKVGDKKIDSYDDLLKQQSLISALMGFVTKLQEGFKKKKKKK
jgi:hypothetical protein